MMPLVFELITILAVLGLGFVLGRIWEIRQQEILRQKNEKAGFEIPTAYLSPIRPRPSHWVADASSASNLLQAIAATQLQERVPLFHRDRARRVHDDLKLAIGQANHVPEDNPERPFAGN